MRNLLMTAMAGIAAAGLAGVAIAANPSAKTMEVPLADGSRVTVHYVGDVAPRVRILPAPSVDPLPALILPDFIALDRMFADMRRRHARLMQEVEALSRQPLTDHRNLNLAATGNVPEGTTSVSVVSISNGGKTCTRTTEVVSQGDGKPPKVTTEVSGDCGPDGTVESTPATLSHT